MNVTLSGIPLSDDELSIVLGNLVRRQGDLSDEIDQLQNQSVGGACFPTQVVTDVQESPLTLNLPLTVRKTTVCLPTQ